MVNVNVDFDGDMYVIDVEFSDDRDNRTIGIAADDVREYLDNGVLAMALGVCSADFFDAVVDALVAAGCDVAKEYQAN